MEIKPTQIEQNLINTRQLDQGIYTSGHFPNRISTKTLRDNLIKMDLYSISEQMKRLYGNFAFFVKRDNTTYFLTSASSQGFFVNGYYISFDYQEILNDSELSFHHTLNYVHSHHGVRPHSLDKNSTFVPPMSVGKITDTISDLHTWANVVSENNNFGTVFEELISNYKKQFPKSEHVVFFSGGVDSTLILLFLNHLGMNPLAVHLRSNRRDTVFAKAVCDEFGIDLEIIDPRYEYNHHDSFNWLPTLGSSPTDYISDVTGRNSLENPVFWHGQNADTVYHVENDSVKSRLDYVGDKVKSKILNVDVDKVIKELNDSYWEYRKHSKIDTNEEIHHKIMESNETMLSNYRSWRATSNVTGIAQEARLYRFFQRMANAGYRLRRSSDNYHFIMPFNEFSIFNFFNAANIPTVKDALRPKKLYHDSLKQKFNFDHSGKKNKILLNEHKWGLVEEIGDNLLPKPFKNIYSRIKLDPRFAFINYDNANVFSKHSNYLIESVINDTKWVVSLNKCDNLGDLIVESNWFSALLANEPNTLSKQEFMALSKIDYLHKNLMHK
jgi:hypothetical protein